MKGSKLKKPDHFSNLSHDQRMEIYRLAFEHTESEVGALWKRNDAFLIANSILALLVVERISEPIFAASLALFCLFISVLWARANRYSAQWERFWIRECRRLETRIQGCDIWTRAGKLAGKPKGGPSIKYDSHELYLSLVFVMGWSCVLLYLLVVGLK